jgi:hypothetical protein
MIASGSSKEPKNEQQDAGHSQSSCSIARELAALGHTNKRGAPDSSASCVKSMEAAMRKVSEYEQHANECREMVRKMRNQHHKRQLEDMAQAWEMLAKERARQLAKEQAQRAKNSN